VVKRAALKTEGNQGFLSHPFLLGAEESLFSLPLRKRKYGKSKKGCGLVPAQVRTLSPA